MAECGETERERTLPSLIVCQCLTCVQSSVTLTLGTVPDGAGAQAPEKMPVLKAEARNPGVSVTSPARLVGLAWSLSSRPCQGATWHLTCSALTGLQARQAGDGRGPTSQPWALLLS